MASITDRGYGKWQVKIRRKGYPAQSKTFESKTEIAKWRDELVEACKAPTTIRNKATIIAQVFETPAERFNACVASTG